MSVKDGDEWVITANDLLLGGVVYLNAQGGWVTRLAEAQLHNHKPAAEQIDSQQQRHSNVVVGLDAIAVTRAQQGALPKTLREQIRQHGPSIEYISPSAHITSTDREVTHVSL